MAGLGTLRVLSTDVLIGITAYLDIEVWTLRIVSKAFNSLLRDDHVVFQVLKQKYPETTLQNLAAMEKIFKSHYSGIPQSVLQLNTADAHPRSVPVLDGKRLAYRLTAGPIRIVDLETGTGHSIGISGGLDKLVLTSNFVASCSAKKCYVWNLQQSSKSTINIEHDIVEMAGYGALISLLTILPGRVMEVLVYNVDTGALVLRRRSQSLHVGGPHMPKLAMNDRICLIVEGPDEGRFDKESCEYDPDPFRSCIPFADVKEIDIATGKGWIYSLYTLRAHEHRAQSVFIRPAGQYDTWFVGVNCGEYGCNYHHGLLHTGRRMDWKELRVRGELAAHWRGTTWTSSCYTRWNCISAERSSCWDDDEKCLGQVVNRIMQIPSNIASSTTFELMVNDHFLVSYGVKPSTITVYAFGETSLPKTELDKADLSVRFYRKTGLNHCWALASEEDMETKLWKML